jgi:hypothetical protein
MSSKSKTKKKHIDARKKRGGGRRVPAPVLPPEDQELVARMAAALAADTAEESINLLSQLGQHLVDRFFDGSADIASSAVLEREDSDVGFDGFLRLDQVLESSRSLSREREGFLLALSLGAQERWLADNDVPGRERLTPWEREHLSDIDPGEAKKQLIEAYLALPDGERGTEVLFEMVEDGLRRTEKVTSLPLNRILTLVKLNDVSFVLPDVFDRMARLVNSFSVAERAEMTGALRGLRDFVERRILGNIDSLLEEFGRPAPVSVEEESAEVIVPKEG